METFEQATNLSSKARIALSKLANSVPAILIIAGVFYYFEIQVARVYTQYFGTYDPRQIPSFIFFDLYSLFWFLLMPVIVNKFILKESLTSMGLALPQRKIFACVSISLALLVLIPYMLYCATQAQFQGYSLENTNIPRFIFMMIVMFPPFYAGEEFFFRSFLFLNLWKRIGWHSFWITDLLFTLSHLGKPVLEILLCIPATVIFNFLTLYNRSVLPAIIVHTCLGITLSLVVTFKLLPII